MSLSGLGYHTDTSEEKRNHVEKERKNILQRKSFLAMASARSFWHGS
jgi:hypothetical protein